MAIKSYIEAKHQCLEILNQKTLNTNELLTYLQENKASPDEIISLLQQKNKKDGWTLGMIISRYKDGKKTQQYLDLLTSLQKNIQPKDILALLQQQNKDGWTFGMHIARNQDAKTTQQYLDLLISLQKDIQPKDIFALLQHQNKNGWTLGMIIARYQDAKTTQQYLDLLAFLQKDIQPKDIFALLQQKNKDGWTLGMIIARNQDAITTQQYLNLLISLQKDIQPKDIFALLQKHDIEDGWTLGMFIARWQDSEIIYQYKNLFTNSLYGHISSKDSLSKDEYEQFNKHTLDVVKYILNLDRSEKEAALTAALDKESPLGKYFWRQSSIFSRPSLAKGYLKQFHDELNKLKKENFQQLRLPVTEKSSLSMQPRSTEASVSNIKTEALEIDALAKWGQPVVTKAPEFSALPAPADARTIPKRINHFFVYPEEEPKQTNEASSYGSLYPTMIVEGAITTIIPAPHHPDLEAFTKSLLVGYLDRPVIAAEEQEAWKVVGYSLLDVSLFPQSVEIKNINDNLIDFSPQPIQQKATPKEDKSIKRLSAHERLLEQLPSVPTDAPVRFFNSIADKEALLKTSPAAPTHAPLTKSQQPAS